jgi:enolase
MRKYPPKAIIFSYLAWLTVRTTSGKQAFDAGWSVLVSHRSSETTDDFIAGLTVALRTGHLKAGAPARSERVAKYNRLMDIEYELSERKVRHRYAGTDFRILLDRIHTEPQVSFST